MSNLMTSVQQITLKLASFLTPEQIEAEVAKIKSEVGNDVTIIVEIEQTVKADVAAVGAVVAQIDTGVKNVTVGVESIVSGAKKAEAVVQSALQAVAPEIAVVQSALQAAQPVVDKLVHDAPSALAKIESAIAEVEKFIPAHGSMTAAIAGLEGELKKIVPHAPIKEIETEIKSAIVNVPSEIKDVVAKLKAKEASMVAWAKSIQPLPTVESLLKAPIAAKLPPLPAVLTSATAGPSLFTPLVALEKGILGRMLSFAGSATGSTLKFTGKIAMTGLGAALSAPLKLAGAMTPLSLKFALGAALMLGVAGSVYAGYLHMEHNTERLIAEAKDAATKDVVSQYQGISEELTRQQARVHSEAMLDLTAADRASDEEIDAAEAEAEAQSQAEQTPVVSNSKSKKVKHEGKSHSLDGLKSSAARADRLLESASRHAR